MTDVNTEEDLELFDNAEEVFPNKDDLRDRLVLVWVTGKTGMRKSTVPGNKPYEWIETRTLVIDDGPNWTGQVMDSDSQAMRDARVPSVNDAGPTLLSPFQYSFGGMTARLKQRIGADGKPSTFKPMLGRINSRPNQQRGMAPSWSVAEPTPDDQATARRYADKIREITGALKAEIERPASDEAAFD